MRGWVFEVALVALVVALVVTAAALLGDLVCSTRGAKCQWPWVQHSGGTDGAAENP